MKNHINLPNNLSIFRIILVPVFLGCLTYYSPERSYLYPVSIAVFSIACVTDAIDGYLARKLRQRTVLGSYIDPIADKLLILSGFLALSFMRTLPVATHIPVWVTISVITRDGIILLGSTIIFIITGRLKAEPLFIGKATTVCQMLTLFAALFSAPAPLQLTLQALVFIATVASGLIYIRMGQRLIGA